MLEEVVVPNVTPKGLRVVEAVAFINCRRLKKLRLPVGCEIASDAFQDAGMNRRQVQFFDAETGENLR